MCKLLHLCSKTLLKIVQLLCEKDFLLIFKKPQVILTSFKVKSLVNSVKGKKIAITTSLRFISSAISFCHCNVKLFREVLHFRLQSLLVMVDDIDKHCIISYLSSYRVFQLVINKPKNFVWSLTDYHCVWFRKYCLYCEIKLDSELILT